MLRNVLFQECEKGVNMCSEASLVLCKGEGGRVQLGRSIITRRLQNHREPSQTVSVWKYEDKGITHHTDLVDVF